MSEAVAGQKFALPTDGGTGVRIFGELSRPGAVGTVATSPPESPALATLASDTELRGGTSRLFSRWFIARLYFICITTARRRGKKGQRTKNLLGQSADFDDDEGKFKAGR